MMAISKTALVKVNTFTFVSKEPIASSESASLTKSKRKLYSSPVLTLPLNKCSSPAKEIFLLLMITSINCLSGDPDDLLFNFLTKSLPNTLNRIYSIP
jgi:hypothetical protein